MNDSSKARSSFATTHWSIVNDVLHSDLEKRRLAASELCESYWYPLYSFARRSVGDRQQAEDLVQSFFCRLLEKETWAAADQQRGRFRTFLIASLKNFMANEWHKQNAQKRGGEATLLSIDFSAGESRYSQEPQAAGTVEQQFDRSWAITLLNQVLKQLEEELIRTGKARQFKVLKPWLSGDGPTNYDQAAEELGLSRDATKMAVSRLRKKYRECLRNEIGQTVLNESEIDDEIRELFAAVKK